MGWQVLDFFLIYLWEEAVGYYFDSLSAELHCALGTLIYDCGGVEVFPYDYEVKDV
jgi:hypothetical protein